MAKRYVAWDDVGLEVQLAQWREQLEKVQGNITHAGEAMGFSARHAFRLTRFHELNAYAAELRKKATGQITGRPKKC